MEMNTRLQVEHPVTEMITGFDLVEWQLRVASGEPLPKKQEDLKKHGHAIEVRIYAEDPFQQGLPSIGRLNHVYTPKLSEHVRIDTGVTAGDTISQYYDPMIAKLIVWDETREGAILHLIKALRDYQITGITTNIPYLLNIVQHPAFQQAKLTTHFIPEHETQLLYQDKPSSRIYALASLFLLLRHHAKQNQQWQSSKEPDSPWHQNNGWRLNLPYEQQFIFIEDNKEIPVKINFHENNYHMHCAGEDFKLHGELDFTSNEMRIFINHEELKLRAIKEQQDVFIFSESFGFHLKVKPLRLRGSAQHAQGSLTSPMPGTIVAIHVKTKQSVKKGMPLAVVEAMKMEHTIYAPFDGVIKEIYFAVGDIAQEGATLIAFEETKEQG
jgi:3-methylcrotonyl-CoA carboxylase alpha subunit